jgi:dipeptidyl aminopeptidase/acylaminoacyl peptidase
MTQRCSMQAAWLRSIARSLFLLAATTQIPIPSIAADAPQVMRASAQAFGHVPEVTDMALSPNGKLLGWIDNSGPISGIAVMDADSGKMLRTLAFEQSMKMRRVEWADDATLLVDVSVTATISVDQKYAHEWLRTVAVDVASGATRVLLMDDYRRIYVSGSEVLAFHPSKPHTVVMSTVDYSRAEASKITSTHIRGERRVGGWVRRLYEVDTRTGKGDPIDSGNQFTDDYLVDGEGRPVVRSEFNPEYKTYRVYAAHGASWKELKLPSDAKFRLLGLTSDGAAVVMMNEAETGPKNLWSVALDGSGSAPISVDDGEVVESGVVDPYTNALVGLQLGGAEPTIRWLDNAFETRAQKVERAFAGKMRTLRSSSRDAKRVLVKVSTPSTPAIYYLVDFSKGTADIAGEEYSSLTQVPMGELQAISYKARDGQEIPAYLTLPPSAPKQPLPMIVLPHGGPEARDYPEFDWLVQFLATRGYVVLQPQFRGSTGFGEAFKNAGHHQWGLLMQDDVTDGVRAMIEQKVADPSRICIVGASYGGYAALAGATYTSSLYRCAASISGVSDLPKFIQYQTIQHGDESDAVNDWREHIGSPLKAEVVNRSPARAAVNVTASVLLIHGLDDTVVPFEQSQMMDTALKAAGKQSRLVALKAEDHWLSRSETRTQVLMELEKFLAESLK